MNTNLNKQYKDKDELRQALLELHYDLLDEPEATELRAAIVSDADVAAEWANTMKLAGKIADAAKLPVQSGPKTLAANPVPNKSQSPQRAPSAQVEKSSVWLTPTLVAGLAALLAFLVVGWWHLSELPTKLKWSTKRAHRTST